VSQAGQRGALAGRRAGVTPGRRIRTTSPRSASVRRHPPTGIPRGA
jgi:hypothetical protein